MRHLFTVVVEHIKGALEIGDTEEHQLQPESIRQTVPPPQQFAVHQLKSHQY